MNRNTTVIFIAALLWMGSLVGTYVAGKYQGTSEAALEVAQAQKARDEAIAMPGNRAGTKNGAPNGAEGALPEGKVSLEEILLQFHNLTRMGATMQNPSAMMKVMVLLDKIRPEDFPQALAEAEKMTDLQGKMLLHMVVLGKWAETNGPEAMAYAEEHSKDSRMPAQMAKMSVAASWAEKDPEAVWKWYQKSEKDTDGPMSGQMVLMSLFSSMAAKDPELALQRLEEIEGTGRQMAMAGMFQSVLFDEEKRAVMLAHVDKMTDPTERKQAKQMMLNQWCALAPDEAMEYVRAQPAEDQNDLRNTSGYMFMMQDPRKGAEFILEGATDENRAQRYSTIVSQWAYQDANAAGDWLNEQPQGPHLDSAKQAFVNAAAQKDPESAMVWAASITDANMRANATAQTYQVWKQKDAPAAEEALKNSGLTEEQIKNIQGGNATKSPQLNPPHATEFEADVPEAIEK